MKCKERVYAIGVSVCIMFLVLTMYHQKFFETTVVDSPDSERQRAVRLTVSRKKLSKSNFTSGISDHVENEEDKGQIEQSTKSTDNLIGQVNYTDSDVDQMLQKLNKANWTVFDFNRLKGATFAQVVYTFHKNHRKGRHLPAFKRNKKSKKNWELFHQGIHQTGMYDPMDGYLIGLLRDLTFQPITGARLRDGGTQIKLIIKYQNGGKALFKPMRFPRDVETIPDHFYFNDYERHHAEIAAFHLDWILGFYNVPPTIGRKINMSSEIRDVADRKLAKKFYISPVNNLCFYGDCSYYCDTNHAVCGKPDLKEGSFAALLPSEDDADRITWENPWRRSYSKRKRADWELNDDFCDEIKRTPPFDEDRRLLELIDMHIFDFLQGNMDRHHYETYTDFGNNTFLLHYDNGRGCGKTKHDEMSILAPLYQCCQIQYSTFMKLVKLYIGPERLSELMRDSLAKDSLNPILTEPHLFALDRRVIKVLKVVFECLKDQRYISDVIIDRPWNV